MLAQELEDRNNALFGKLVPISGNCQTLEGELLRAVNRICYRWFNDGDYWYMGYGCETAGPAESFLRLHSPIAIRDKVRDILSRSDDKMKAAYEDCLSQLMETVVTYIEGRGDTLTPNSLDMLDMESLYEDNDDNLYDDDDEDAFYEDKASRHVDEDEDF